MRSRRPKRHRRVLTPSSLPEYNSVMGCVEGKQTKEQEHGHINNNADDFTENQIDTLTSTWPLLSKEMKRNGLKVFRFVFQTEPKIKHAFTSYRDMSDEDILSNDIFQHHVDKFMQTIGTVIDNLDSNKEEVQKTLLVLGAKHAMFEGFREEYFGIMTKCLVEVWENVIAEEFIPEVKDSWDVLFTYIVRYMSKGYMLYIHDQT